LRDLDFAGRVSLLCELRAQGLPEQHRAAELIIRHSLRALSGPQNRLARICPPARFDRPGAGLIWMKTGDFSAFPTSMTSVNFGERLGGEKSGDSGGEDPSNPKSTGLLVGPDDDKVAGSTNSIGHP